MESTWSSKRGAASLGPCIWRKRAAFQSFVAKLRPSSICFSSKAMSCPLGAIRISPKRKPSAPYFAIRSSGSGELPSDFDILRPFFLPVSPGQKNVTKWDVVFEPLRSARLELQSRNDHACDPKENDIR